jgi:disulfide bond formation protein DsbB
MAALNSRSWPYGALLISALMLGVAHAFETFGHLLPCTLCLKQREVYWAAMAIAAAGVVGGFFTTRLARPVCAILAAAFLVGAGVAIWHAGAEWKFWPGPKECASTNATVTMADMQRFLAGQRGGVPHCDQAPWVFLGLSMAGWNALISLGLAGASLAAARKRP